MSTRFIQGSPANYQGRVDGAAVPAGQIGEIVHTVQTTIAANSTVSGNITTLALPSSGIWLLNVTYIAAGTGTANGGLFQLGISNTSNSFSGSTPWAGSLSGVYIPNGTSNPALRIHTGPITVNTTTAATTTLYLICDHTTNVNYSGNVHWKFTRVG